MFIGVGSSSLLSQKVLLEFNQRFSEYIEEKQNREFLGSLNEDGYRNDSKNLFSFYLITFGTFFGYYLFWIINYNSYAIQILEENRINNYYENFTNITNNIDINLNTSRINDIYSKNKEIFFFYLIRSYAFIFIVSFIIYFILLSYMKKKEKISPNENETLRINSNDEIKKDKGFHNYSACIICGYVFFSENNNLKGDISFCKKIFYYLKDLFFFSCQTLQIVVI